MKKSLFLLILGAVFVGFCSCNNKDCTCTHTPAPDCKFHKQTIDIYAAQADWLFDSNAQQFYMHFDIEELTADVYNYGEVSISREFNSKTKDAYQVMLPQSFFMVDEATNANYTQHIDYRYGIGFVEIQVTNSDHLYSSENPESMLFRMQLTY